MANPEHLKKLLGGVSEFNAWRGIAGSPVDLSNADLSENRYKLRQINLELADLSGTNLSGADLSFSNFSNADLFGADLHGVQMDEANFGGARLTNADLRDASLSATNLALANLSNANLSGAFLSACLTGCGLRQTNFSYVLCYNCVFARLSFASAIGLDTVRHLGPSSISTDTLLLSNGKIPDSFLRGCGIPETLIRYLPSLTNQALDFYSCFISYSHADKAFARRLHDALQGRGIRCWLDEHQLLPGHDFHDAIDRGIRLWDKTILCASENSLKSWWCDGEISKTFAKEQQLMKERGKKVHALIPLNLDGHLFKWDSGKASEVRTRLAANFVGWENDNSIFEREFERLVLALRTDDPLPPPPVSKL